MITARNVAALTLLTAAAAGSWYLAGSLHSEPPPRATGSDLQTGYYLKDARVLGTDEQGKLLYEIEADYAEQQADDSIEFTNVRIHYASAADVPWHLRANKAHVTASRDQLALSGNVVAASSEGLSGQPTEIRTEWLEVAPALYTAKTNRRVQILVGERSVTATGMRASFNESRLELTSNVSGKFLP